MSDVLLPFLFFCSQTLRLETPSGWLFQRRHKFTELYELVGRRGKPLWESHREREKTDVLAAVLVDNESAPSARG